VSQINTDVLDVDFAKCPEFTFGDAGVRRAFGPSSFEQRFGVLSEQEIEQAIDAQEANGGALDLLVSRIYDQGQEGACASNATCQAHEIVQAKQRGIKNVVHLSAISLYKRVRLSGGGSFIDDNWEELQQRGVLPLDTPENRDRFDALMPNTGRQKPFPPNWEATARRLAGLEATPIQTTPGLLTALVTQHPCVVGRDGHAICYTRIMRHSGRKVAKYANSWSERWGEAGFGYDSESKIRSAARWAFALRSVRAAA